MNAKKISLAASLLLLHACALGPNYTRPDFGLDSSYRNAVATPSERAVSDIAWAELFQDPELSAVIRTAVARNIDLQIALTRIDAAQAQNQIAYTQYFPALSGTLGTSPSAAAGSNNSYNLGAALNWELDFFGKIRRANEATRADLLASEDGARAVMSTLVANTAITWLNLRTLDQELRITQANIKTQEDSLALVRSLLRGGVSSGAEEQQAIVQLANTRAQLPKVQQAILATENALSLLLDGQPGAITRNTVADLPETPLMPKTGMPSELLERRPDVRAAEHTLEAATARVGVAIANRFPIPTLSLSGFLGLAGIDLGDTLSNSGNTQSITSWGPNASVPLIDWSRGTNNVRAAHANVHIAALSYRATVLNALREVSNALSATQNMSTEIEQYTLGTEAAKKNLHLQQIRYKAGVNSYFEVLDAQRQLFSSELALIRARRDHLLAYIDLYRALGGGWADAALHKAEL